MIDPSVIQELLDKEPFNAFRVRMADGQHYDISDPSLVVAMVDTLFVALPKRDRFKLLSYQNITSIESPLQPA